MRRVVVGALLGLSLVASVPSFAEDAKVFDAAREVAALRRDVERLRTESAALKKQVEDLKKAQGDTNGHVAMLLTHRHQLFLDFLSADAFFPKAKGTFFVTTPAPENLTKTSGPVSGPK